MKLTSIGHAVGGIITGVLTGFQPLLAILIAIIFIIYETDEGWKIKDASYEDIKEYLIGLFLSIPVIIAVKVMGV